VFLLGAASLAQAQATQYVYDSRNKLVEVRQGDSILARFQWDADGRLIRKIGQLGIRDYVYDGRRLLGEHDESGHQLAKYNWAGDRVVSVERAGEGLRYFHYDGLGSVVALTDGAGSVVAHYRWDAWGNLRNQEALTASQNRIGYTGHRFDDEIGLHHAQTRHLDPATGRFTTPDAYLGEPEDPASQNRFAYAQGNPTKYVDPTGEFVFLVPILIGVIAAELDIIQQEITQGRDLLTLDPSKGVDAAKAAKKGAIATVAAATGQLLAAGALAGTGALGIGATAAGATGATTGSALIAGTVGGAGAAWTGGTLAGLGEGKSLDAAVDQGNIAALPGTIGGAAGVLAGVGVQGLASSAGAGPAATRGLTAFAGGFAGDQAAQQTMIAAGLQERTNLAQSFASGAVAYVVTEGRGTTARLEPAIRQPPSSVRFGPINPGSLPEKVAQTFRGGSYTETILSQPTVLYRAYGGTSGQLGPFWTRTPPSGQLQARMDLALRPEWGNTATKVVKIEVPAGTKIYEGFAEAQGSLVGGGSQVVIPKVDPRWVIQ
jgi:RHS repeat-associated protein